MARVASTRLGPLSLLFLPLCFAGATSVAVTACDDKASDTGGTSDSGSAGSTGDESDSGPITSSPSGGSDPDTTASGGSNGTDTGPDDSGDDGMDSGGFITPPDGGIEGQCDPAAQDCPEGQKCSSYVSTPGGATVDATHCVDVMGDVQWGEQCTRIEGNDDCAAGLFCMTDISGNTGEGLCLEYCEINQPCEFGGECFAFNDGALPLCEVECDPLFPACPDGQGCYAAFDSFVCATPGFPAGAGGDGDTCATIQGCQPGLLCKGGTAGCTTESGCCTPVCDLSGGADQCSDPSESCVAALEQPGPGQEDVGYCTVPE
jgi:hypothetical protein